MIDRVGKKILIECDGCSEVYTGQEGEEFAQTWANAKADGWRTRKIGEEWLHGCPHCGV